MFSYPFPRLEVARSVSVRSAPTPRLIRALSAVQFGVRICFTKSRRARRLARLSVVEKHWPEAWPVPQGDGERIAWYLAAVLWHDLGCERALRADSMSREYEVTYSAMHRSLRN